MAGLRWTDGSAGEVGTDVGAEARHLVAQLVDRAGGEPELQVPDAHRAVLVQLLGQVVGRAGARVRRQVPAGVADVEVLGDHAHVDRRAGPHLVTVLLEVGDRVGHLLLRSALRDPAVAPLRDAPQRRLRRATDPDRWTGRLRGPGPESDVADVLVGPRGPDAVDRLVRQPAALREREA